MKEAIEELRKELLKSDGGSLHPATRKDLEDAMRFGFPEVLLEFYRQNAPDATDGRIELDQRIWSVQKAITENRDYVPGAELFPLGYVVFASNKFGDAYCVDTIHPGESGELPIVLLPHDEFPEGASLQAVEGFRLAVAENLEDFIRKFTRRVLVEQANHG